MDLVSERAQGADPTLSLIVPTHNRRERLGRLLAGLEREHARGAEFEVVVTVDGSTDGTEAMLAALRTPYPLKVVTQAQRGAPAARNAAIAAAAGEVLLFVDDDVVPQDGLLERHVAVHRDDPLAAVAGRMARPTDQTLPLWLDWEATLLERHYARVVAGVLAASWHEFFTANASVRRAHALAVGGFDERFLREEDIEFAYRLAKSGLRFHFLSDAVVRHDSGKTLETYLRMAFERGRYQYMFKGERMREEWVQRHPLDRMLARWCIGHSERTRIVVDALERLIAAPRVGPRRLQFLLCSALVNIKYWAGVAEATGLGVGLWRLMEPPVGVQNRG
jgi:GT2 family glycosyltransferase